MLSEKAAMIFILIITAFFITYFYRARDGIRTPRPSPWQGDTPPLSHSRIYVFNRGDRIRTCDLLVPNQAL